MTRVLVVRLDSDGDVLLSGPAIRAVAAGADEVVALVGPRGRQAAGLLPGVDAVAVWRCPWVDGEPQPVTREGTGEVVDALAALRVDEAVVLTSFHQSPLPTALVLRLAGVPRITAASVDYPGSLLDVRLRPGDPALDPTVDLPDDLPEAERALAIAERAGYALPPGDDGRLAVTVDDAARREAADLLAAHEVDGDYVVLHPGASVPARAWSPHRAAEGVAALTAAGHRVVVTGAPGETALTAEVAGRAGVDLGGRTGFGTLAAVLARARAVVVGNTGPAHLAAAVGVPVISLFAPVVPPERWAPYGVPRILLGDQDAPCRGTRARTCPVPGHPCLDGVRGDDVVKAVTTVVYGE
ncbi:glycosyltransferase family 9 protein [Actinomycetospora straminea]|uniref:Glycosyltransferase family 9 protein n=1 Tax=Actinomycetospora straminea TaxID=663607 RepID=A0ABP9F4G3_9PSEU|nr:glycosyltransferase family 9 protein [Actinomycetospora straminea]MDD7936130.1 glycosyltransferase family 9 protein [Actinomycetospora straminea]